MASRTIQDVEERGELKLTRAQRIGPDMLLTSLYVGALGIERAVNTVLLGASLPFVTPGKNSVAGVLGGGGLEWRTREGISFFGAAEAIGMSDQGTVISARRNTRGVLSRSRSSCGAPATFRGKMMSRTRTRLLQAHPSDKI